MIRIATKDDLPEVSKLWVDMVKELSPTWNPDGDYWVDVNARLFDVDMNNIVIAEDKGIVGFLDGVVFYEPGIGKKIGFAKHFYLKPEYRETGLSLRMYDKIVSIARAKGAEVLEIQCFSDRLEYWKGFGFKPEQHTLRRAI